MKDGRDQLKILNCELQVLKPLNSVVGISNFQHALSLSLSLSHEIQQIQLKTEASTNILAIWKVCIFLKRKIAILKYAIWKHNLKNHN